jgi:hypothetical protein
MTWTTGTQADGLGWYDDAPSVLVLRAPSFLARRKWYFLKRIESFLSDAVSNTKSGTFEAKEIDRAFSPHDLDHGNPSRWPGLV